MVMLSRFKLHRHAPPMAHKYHPRNRPKQYSFGKIITFLATPVEVFFLGFCFTTLPRYHSPVC